MRIVKSVGVEHNNIVSPQNYSWFLQQTSAIAAMVFGSAKTKDAGVRQMAGGV